ncbi:hypothetical protein [Flavobacterium nackdongense]|uniref:Uncharacterized protein n=1 Tax=Flavobacterium nackdongense TaxID=2547394 RepID=A0A4V1AH62_9FLAO|nr:hypothetical protein [Flavobacterium nackdongense]QBN20432.1 hypothetical protein E1750_17090 [Flavobacterium nackdongense]
MKLTTVQKITVVLLVMYLIWEIVVQYWATTEKTAVIRADLALIYPILLIFILISVVQIFRKK